jgi:hypothetical protein
MEQNVRAVIGRQLQASKLGLNPLGYRQYKGSAAKARTCRIMTCKLGVRNVNRRNLERSGQISPRLLSAVHTVKEFKHKLSKELEHLWQSLPGPQELESVELKATVVLCRKEFFVMPVESTENWDLEDEQSGKRVYLQLISTLVDPSTGKPMRTSEMAIENWTAANSSSTNLSTYEVNFKVKKDFGEPGALVVKSFHRNEFLLKDITVALPNHAKVHFACDSCVYNADNYAADRVFFTNKVSLSACYHLPCCAIATAQHSKIISPT